jgi:hypothetical protein
MNKNLSNILFFVLAVGSITRSSNLGWGFFIGIPAIILAGLIHWFVQRNLYKYSEILTVGDKAFIFFCHLTYLGSLIFQSDGGDAGPVIAIENITRLNLYISYDWAWNLSIFFTAFFILLNTLGVIRIIRLRNKIKSQSI